MQTNDTIGECMSLEREDVLVLDSSNDGSVRIQNTQQRKQKLRKPLQRKQLQSLKVRPLALFFSNYPEFVGVLV